MNVPGLSASLPPTLQQQRDFDATIHKIERPIKQLMFAYFELFKNSGGPKYRTYRNTASNIESFQDLPADFVDKKSLYYLPESFEPREVEVLVFEDDHVQRWELWDISLSLVPSDAEWDPTGRIENLPDEEKMNVRRIISEMIQMGQYCWMIIAKRFKETQNFVLKVDPQNITLALQDPLFPEKCAQLEYRLGIDITIKDKIENTK